MVPLDQLCRVFAGFWICQLCTAVGKPGGGRSWQDMAASDSVRAAMVVHLVEHHGAWEIL